MSKIKETWDTVPKWMKYTLYTVLGVAGAFLLGLLFGNVVRWLWNWLMPGLFGLRTIGFWEGLGLFALARILFGGFGDSSKSHKSGDEEKESACRKKKQQGTNDHHENWELYEDWWDEDGKAAFSAYAERMKKEPEEAKPEEN